MKIPISGGKYNTSPTSPGEERHLSGWRRAFRPSVGEGWRRMPARLFREVVCIAMSTAHDRRSVFESCGASDLIGRGRRPSILAKTWPDSFTGSNPVGATITYAL